MNERIRELAEQADKLVSEENKYYGLMEYSEKFAQLIVQECIFISRTSTDGFSAGRRMAERFGVES